MASGLDKRSYEVIPVTSDSVQELGERLSISVENVATPSYASPLSSSKKPKDLAWLQVNFQVGEKSVLKDCWGQVKAGNICAIMGPSGAGKSSLLNVLAGRSASGSGITINGKITVGGKEIHPVAYRRNIAYVMQDDALMPTATPREALLFSANLRLPATLSKQEVSDRVEKLLKDLGIADCADVMIGGALLKGISGGQRKRTSVGVEIITDPSLLFLDEPTSGLDSFSAYNLVVLLKQLAATNCAILCTIHQPSSEVFFLFDTVIYMKDGLIFYQGSTADIVPFYASKNIHCPENYNPGDFVMNICQKDSLEELQKMDLFVSVPAEFHDSIKVNSNQTDEHVVFVSESSFLKQMVSITYRELINTCRDKPALYARFGITVVLSLLNGLIFLGVGGKSNSDESNFSSHFGGLMMVLIFGLFGTAQSVLLSFPFERPMILREYATGTYSLQSYFISKIFVEAPLTFAQLVVEFILVYFMMDLQGSFILLLLTCFGLGMVSNSVAMALGCLVPEVKDVTELAPLLYVPQILFAGFFIRTAQIPSFLRWAQYLCSMKYAMDLLLLNEFSLSNKSCQGAAEANCRAVQETNDVDGSLFWLYIIILLILFIGFRVLGAIILAQKAKKFY